MSYIFGPVPSRRLGRSLGIDVIPPKTCSFDCIYCESGPTTHLSVKREDFADPAAVLSELNTFLRLHPNATDVLTFSSGGEPTLYLGLGELIAAIKKAYPRFPLIVLTNGSLLWDPE
ncbi:MAG: radical SAM protein, partial [Syntrophobacteraceae bacterium]